jgi:hypothetical protein
LGIGIPHPLSLFIYASYLDDKLKK